VSGGRPVPAKGIIADALVYLDVAWTGSQIRTALALADFMFGSKREARVSQAAIARKRRCHETRVREHLAVLCRRPGYAHRLEVHAFVRSYVCVPWGEGRPGGRKVSVFRLAEELEAAVLAARIETPAGPADRDESEAPEDAADRLASETPEFCERNAGVAPSETTPRGPQESGKKPALNPATDSGSPGARPSGASREVISETNGNGASTGNVVVAEVVEGPLGLRGLLGNERPAAPARRPRRAAKPPADPACPAWSGEACDDWQVATGGTAPGARIGAALRPLVQAHGWATVRPVWQRYLVSKDGKFGAEYFAQRFGLYARDSVDPTLAALDAAFGGG
jgi:hypothetical protein